MWTWQPGLGRKHAAFRAQRDELNRMDRQTVEFYARVREGYLTLVAQEPDRWVVVDAGPRIEAIQADIRRLWMGAARLARTVLRGQRRRPRVRIASRGNLHEADTCHRAQ